MSNIPLARRILKDALERDFDNAADLCRHIEDVLQLLDRKKPDFVARRVVKGLTWHQKIKVREMRSTGMALNAIALRMGTNIGRVSEAINEEI